MRMLIAETAKNCKHHLFFVDFQTHSFLNLPAWAFRSFFPSTFFLANKGFFVKIICYMFDLSLRRLAENMRVRLAFLLNIKLIFEKEIPVNLLLFLLYSYHSVLNFDWVHRENIYCDFFQLYWAQNRPAERAIRIGIFFGNFEVSLVDRTRWHRYGLKTIVSCHF